MAFRTDARLNPPSAVMIARYWEGAEPEFVLDLRTPACFACGWANPKAAGGNWSMAHLERAHIIGWSIGAAETDRDPANYLLLCPRCHRDAPMCELPEVLLQWVADRESWFDFQYRSLTQECARAGLDLGKLPSEDELPYLFEYARAIRTDFHTQKRGAHFEVGMMVPVIAAFVRQKEADAA